MKYHMDQFLYKQLNKVNKEKNPEMLTVGGKHTSDFADVKAQYGAAVRQTAEEKSRKLGRYKRRNGRACVGGQVVDTAKSRFSEYSAKEDSAETYTCIRLGCNKPTWDGTPGTFCGRTCRDLARRGAALQSSVPDPESGVSVTGVHPILAAETVGRQTQPSGYWEYETGHGFERFRDDCQETLEEHYQAFQNGGNERVTIQTSGRNISVDFRKMTQVVEGSHKVRDVRRKER